MFPVLMMAVDQEVVAAVAIQAPEEAAEAAQIAQQFALLSVFPSYLKAVIKYANPHIQGLLPSVGWCVPPSCLTYATIRAGDHAHEELVFNAISLASLPDSVAGVSTPLVGKPLVARLAGGRGWVFAGF